MITHFPLFGLPLLLFSSPPSTLRASQIKLISSISGLGNFPDSPGRQVLFRQFHLPQWLSTWNEGRVKNFLRDFLDVYYIPGRHFSLRIKDSHLIGTPLHRSLSIWLLFIERPVSHYRLSVSRKATIS